MKIKCIKCGDIIDSKHRHDMVWCKCGSVAIDGGADYHKVSGYPEDFDLIDEETGKPYSKAVQIIAKYSRYGKNGECGLTTPKRDSGEDMVQKGINTLSEYGRMLEQMADEAIDETAKQENKTRDQVVKDWMKSCEGKTCCEFWKEIKDE